MPSKNSDAAIRMLLLAGDRMGSNCFAGGKKLSILDKFKKYGWDLTLAATTKTVEGCPFAQQKGWSPPPIDCLVDESPDVSTFDGISVLPGTSYDGLTESDRALELIRHAAKEGLIVSAWCRGVKVLAVADVIRGKQIVGHKDDQEAIEKAGGIFVGQDHPPITDGNVVTGARSYHYRAKNAEAIKKAIDARRAELL
jgi:putative intracellular protease/amidase